MIFENASVVEGGLSVVHHLIPTGFEESLELLYRCLVVVDEPGEGTGH